MRFFDWLRPGLRIKRWIIGCIIGILGISYGLALFITNGFEDIISVISGICLVGAGSFLMAISVVFVVRTFISAINGAGLNYHVDSKMLRTILIEKKYLDKGPRIVAIGGGTGLSTMLRGLKVFTSNVTAVVTVSDDGGGSGILREDLGMLPPGDIRNCILALARTEPILEKLIQYRFKEGMLKGQNFGNLFLAAMTGICGSFEEAVKKMSDVLAVTGDVLPVSTDDVRLCAELEDGSIVYGERNIALESKARSSQVKRIFIEPSDARALDEVINTIKEADIIIMGPGSLYTSIIPNLLVDGVAKAVRETSAPKVYVCNIMTQKGESDDFSAFDHIRAIEDHIGEGCIDYCIVNRGRINKDARLRYDFDGAQRVRIDAHRIINHGIKIVRADVIKVDKDYIRHDPLKLAATILKLINEEINLKEKKRMIEYLYVRDRIKKLASG